MNRERARFKVYPAGHLTKVLDPSYDMYMPKSHKGDKGRTLASHSTLALVETLNKANRERLYRMMESDFPIGKFVEGTGLKVPFTRPSNGDLFVYVIDGVAKKSIADHPERETVYVRRFNPEKFNQWIANKWNPSIQKWEPAPLTEQVTHYMRNSADEVKPVFKDRLTKAERTKLSLLHLIEPETYIEGIGGVWMNRWWDYAVGGGRGSWVAHQRVYFIQGGKSEGVS